MNNVEQRSINVNQWEGQLSHRCQNQLWNSELLNHVCMPHLLNHCFWSIKNWPLLALRATGWHIGGFLHQSRLASRPSHPVSLTPQNLTPNFKEQWLQHHGTMRRTSSLSHHHFPWRYIDSQSWLQSKSLAWAALTKLRASCATSASSLGAWSLKANPVESGWIWSKSKWFHHIKIDHDRPFKIG